MRSGDPSCVVQMLGISKQFPGVSANQGIDLSIAPGEIHALLGENGAGKTTLMNILYGLVRPDAGAILLDARPVVIHSPADAIALGIGMVHQRPLLVDRLSIIENVLLGLSNRRRGLANTSREEQQLRDLASRYGFQVDPRAEVWTLSAGECQRVEILKALYRGARVLILDEPTSVLTPQEAELLFGLLQAMARDGLSVIYITHKLDEVVAIAHRATVLRHGRVVDSIDVESTSTRALARMMVGREVLFRVEKEAVAPGQPVLEVVGVSVLDDLRRLAVAEVTFKVCQGEIMGIAGVSGSGQNELAEALVGLRRPVAGEIRLAGQAVTRFSPRHFMERGVGYLPENIARDAVGEGIAILENAILKEYLLNRSLRRGPFVNEEAIRLHVEALLKRYDVRAPSLKASAGTLSGGNLRKLVLGRELARDPAVLIVCQPTSGLDVAATEYMYRQLLDQRRQGRAVVLISDNLDEVLQLSDTIGVMHGGRMVATLPAQRADREEIGLMMGGAGSAETR